MNAINFEKPSIGIGVDKPTSLSNQSFPYNHIANPRRFEELLYSIFELKITSGEITEFDEVQLMNGVRDQGRDCALMRNGKCRGVIQCKKYDRNFGKNELGIEIIRFALYSMIDKRIMPYDREFNYYIAVSSGLTSECGKFIDEFSSNILTEPLFDEWVNKNLDLPSLRPLQSTLDLSHLKRILANLNVKRIIPQDLDIYLASESCRSLVPLFFEVRTVVDNSKIEELVDSLKGKVSPKQLLNQLKIGSARLQSERNTFQDIENSHIEREETQQLYNWIFEDPAKKNGVTLNVCLLAGQAGCGKTVVLKDLYNKCVDNDIVVLGLKADKLYSNTIKGLQETLGFALPVHDFIHECKKHFSRIVILIDQIDALSQSMSSDRSYLELYRTLIDYYSNDDNIRFIISVRASDLQYDPSLKIFKDTKSIKLGLLTELQVLQLLAKIGIKKEDMSVKLLELLRVPNHLNIFSQIVSNRSILQAGNLLELYYELWRQKVTEIGSTIPAKRGKIKEVLYLIAQQMFNDQRITVPSMRYDDYHEEIRYLESERLINVEDRQVQFFHQTFYDFVFAKQFAESNASLLKYIKDAEQSIHIRSAVKMIISYLRECDPTQYISSLNDIFFDADILFHIKHILMVVVAGQENPIEQEEDFVLKAFLESFHWKSVFFEHSLSNQWLLFVDQNGLFDILETDYEVQSHDREVVEEYHLEKGKNIAAGFLHRFVIDQNDKAAWTILGKINNKYYIRNILYSLTNWSDPQSYLLFEEIKDFEEKDAFGYYHILDNIAKVNPDYVLAILATKLPQHYKKSSDERHYLESEALKTLAKAVPQKLYPILYDTIKADLIIDLSSLGMEDSVNVYRDYIYDYVNLRDSDESYYDSEFLYHLLAECLKRCASDHSSTFLKFFDEHKKSRYEAVLRLLLFALENNEANFAEQVFELFQYFAKINLLRHGDGIENDLRRILEKGFPFFNDEQQFFVLKTIREYRDLKEIYYRKAEGDMPTILHSNWGLSKFFLIKRLPENVIQQEFKTEFQELCRRFDENVLTDHQKNRRGLAGIVHSPISTDICLKMGLKHWLKAFRRYDSDVNRTGKDFLKGSLRELANSFQTTVKQCPTAEKLQIIKTVINDETLPIKYASYGLWGWIEGKGDKSLIVPLVKELLSKDKADEDRLVISIVANLVGLKKEDREFVDVLVTEALDFQEGHENIYETTEDAETSINGLITKGINTEYGAAAKALSRINDPLFEEVIFQTVTKILSEGPRESRASAIFEFAHLLHLNKERAFQTFATWLNSETDIYVTASSLWSFQYMRGHGNYSVLKNGYDQLIMSGKLGRDDAQMLFMTLYSAYLHNETEAEETLFKLLKYNSKILGSAYREIFRNYYVVDNSKTKNEKLLNYLLDVANESETDELNWSFVHLELIKLEDIYEVLKRFVLSKFFRISDYFLDYLIMQTVHNPYKSVELFGIAIKNKQKKDDRFAIRTEEKALKFIVNSYNGLSQNSNEARLTRQSILLMFDKLLQDYRYRTNSEKILEELI
jgi:hypothetical protein